MSSPLTVTISSVPSSSVNSLSNIISASYAVTASYAANGGSGGSPLISGSTYNITSSWANNTISASYTLSSDTASYQTTLQSYVTLTTGSTNGITASFLYPQQNVTLNVAALYSFTASNYPTTTGQYADTLLYINHNVSGATSSLSFPSAWTNLGTGWPTSITSSKSAMVWLRVIDTNTVIGTYTVQV